MDYFTFDNIVLWIGLVASILTIAGVIYKRQSQQPININVVGVNGDPKDSNINTAPNSEQHIEQSSKPQADSPN